MPITFLQTIPILRIFSVEKAKEFYVDYLGFSIEFEHHFDENTPAYLQVSRAGLVLHQVPAPRPRNDLLRRQVHRGHRLLRQSHSL